MPTSDLSFPTELTSLTIQRPCVPSNRMLKKGQQKLSRAKTSQDGTLMVPCWSSKSVCREYYISQQVERQIILKGGSRMGR